MPGISILRLEEKNALFDSYRGSGSPGRRGTLRENIKETRHGRFTAL